MKNNLISHIGGTPILRLREMEGKSIVTIFRDGGDRYRHISKFVDKSAEM